MEQLKPKLLSILVLLSLGIGPAEGAKPAASKGSDAKGSAPIAVIGKRRVEEADIRRAAIVMEFDPARTRQPAVWRKKLLDLCVDRELLAMEAERQGLLNDPDVKDRIARQTEGVFYDAIRDRVLIPASRPTQAEIDTARAGALFRKLKLHYIITLTDPKTTRELTTALHGGARFDSIAPLYSIHPSSIKGGDVGWKRIRELNFEAWAALKAGKPGDLLGPYNNSQAHEFFKIDDVQEPTDTQLRDALMADRAVEMHSRYDVGLLRKYKFDMNRDAVSGVIFAAATENPDSILASLDADGTRPKRGIHPSLGVLAFLDGDSITYRDIAQPGFLHRDPDGRSRIGDTKNLLTLCMAAALPRLIRRDARERGIDRIPEVVRSVRLIEEEVSTQVMVERAVPAPDASGVRAFFDSHASLYHRPAARRALTAMFVSEDSARMSLWAWSGPAFRDSTLIAYGLRRQQHPTATTLLPGFYAEMPFFDTDSDPLSAAVQSLEVGQISPIIRTTHGYAIVRVLAREEARPLRFDEVPSLEIDAREFHENAWVTKMLERLRAATPARTALERLNAVRLVMNSDTGGKRR